MKKEIKILEIGASSLLDFEFIRGIPDRNIHWIKSYNKNKPKYYSSLTNISRLFRFRNSIPRELSKGVDIVIISIGNKGSRKTLDKYTELEVKELLEINLVKVITTLTSVINYSYSAKKPIHAVLMGSVSGNDGATYVNHVPYAIAKSGLKSLYNNIKEEQRSNNKLILHYLEIPYTSSRMTGGKGDPPDSIRQSLKDLIRSI